MRALAFLGMTGAAVTARIVSTGASVKLNETHYFVSPFSQGKVCEDSMNIENPQSSFGLTPITVVAHVENDLRGLISNWTTEDDVWQPDFLDTILLAGYNGTYPDQATYHSNFSSTILSLAKDSNIPSGPYFLNTFTGEVY